MTPHRLTAEQIAKGVTRSAFKRQIRTASPTLRMIFEEMVRQQMMVKEMAARLKLHANAPSNWRSGAYTPSILTVEEMAHELGYRLVLEPIKKDEST